MQGGMATEIFPAEEMQKSVKERQNSCTPRPCSENMFDELGDDDLTDGIYTFF